MTRETVIDETPARRATSLIVTVGEIASMKLCYGISNTRSRIISTSIGNFQLDLARCGVLSVTPSATTQRSDASWRDSATARQGGCSCFTHAQGHDDGGSAWPAPSSLWSAGRP